MTASSFEVKPSRLKVKGLDLDVFFFDSFLSEHLVVEEDVSTIVFSLDGLAKC